jgi:hypothetical protein
MRDGRRVRSYFAERDEVLFDGPYRLEPERLGMGSLIKSIAVAL